MTDVTQSCQYPNCDQPAIECRLLDPEEVEYLCGEHAADAGYCAACGSFSAGLDGFDLLHVGLCDECADELLGDDEDDDDRDDEEWNDAD